MFGPNEKPNLDEAIREASENIDATQQDTQENPPPQQGQQGEQQEQES